MTNQAKSIPPPLIPLPSPAKQSDPADPFDSLFSASIPSQPILVPDNSIAKAIQEPQTPSSATSDFGSFVSVSASMDPLQQPSPGVQPHTSSTPSETISSSQFFKQFALEAKERAGQNERRVLNELLEHEDDPLYWLNSHGLKREERSSNAVVAILPEFDETSRFPSHHPPSSPPRSSEHEDTPHSPLSISPSTSSLGLNSASVSQSPSRTSTLSRKWMSSLLSNSVPSIGSTTAQDPPLPRSKPGLPRLTHSSPFASHTYIAPTGAPGFAGDHHWNKAGFEFESHDEKLRRVELMGRRESTTPVLTQEIADQLRASLPALPRLAKSWSLLYSMDQHGVSLQTFYSRCSMRVAGTLIAMRDSEDRVFGAWVGERMRVSPGAYYGSGESFLWRTNLSRGQTCVDVFKWTGKNDYVALCEDNFISFGGGEGRYGLYLDSNFIDGSSARCPTFDNAVLCAPDGNDERKIVPFECVGVEAWGVAH